MSKVVQNCDNPNIEKILKDDFVVSLFEVARRKIKEDAVVELEKTFGTRIKKITSDSQKTDEEKEKEKKETELKFRKAKEKIEIPDYAVYFYKRESGNKLEFDRFYLNNGEVCQEPTSKARGQINNVRQCYKSGKSNGFNGKEYILRPILSKVGCLGVVCFSKCPKTQGKTENFLKSCMAAIGNRFLSYIFEYTTSTKQLRLKIENLRQYFPVCDQKSVVMFINIRDFNRKITNNKWEENWTKYDEIYQDITRIIAEHYGVVANFWGGGAMAIFNLLITEDIESACRRSLCAARKIRKILQNDAEVKLGIAGNTGNVLFFAFGNEYESLNNYSGYGQVMCEAKKWENTISGRGSIVTPTIPYNTPNDFERHIILSKEFLGCVCDKCRDEHFSSDICLHSRLGINEICGISEPEKLSCCSNKFSNKLVCNKCIHGGSTK